MGLNTNIRNIESTLTASQTQKKRIEAERIKKEQHKKEIEELKKDIEFYIYDNFFEEIFVNNSKIEELYNIKYKENLFVQCKNTFFGFYDWNNEEIQKTDTKRECRIAYLNENFNALYYKILKQIKQEFTLNQKYIEEKQKEAEQKEAELLRIQQEKERQEAKKASKKLLALKIIIYVILFVTCFPIFLLICLFAGILKN